MIKTQIKKLVSKNKLLSSFFKPGLPKLKKDKNFNSKNYWDERYVSGGNSGEGSYGRLAMFKAEVINNFIDKNKINTVLELGCGDGNQLLLFKTPKYIGLDVSKKSIELCKKQFESDKSKSFFLYEPEYFIDGLNIFKADLTMSLDVIYHLVENETFEKYMHDLFTCSNKYAMIYASNTDKQNSYQSQHVFHRKFSDWIETNFQNWKLLEKIKNKYPHESFADFYIYEKES